MKCLTVLLFIVLHCCLRDLTVLTTNEGIEEDWGDGLKVLTTYKPKECQYKAQNNDIVHYHYVGRLGNSGQVFGQSFDYNSPYIVALGQRRIIAGMDKGLVGTCLWERRRITIPPHLGYGERGVGQIIPPNSTLVFYIRLIKLERDKQTLGVIPSLEDVWNQGLTYYTDQNWQKAIEMIEESLKIFEQYRNHTKHCLQSCENSKQQEYLTNKQETLLAEFDTNVLSFLKYSIKAQCIKQCKKEKLPPSQRNPDPFVLEQFKKRVPYSYLHYSYYQIGNLEEGIKCAFTYYFYHPNDSMIVNSIAYYRKKLGLSKEDVVSREPGKMRHQQFYTSARSAYTSGEWLQSAVLIEKGIKEYKNSLNDCYLLCDDINVINITGDDVSPEKDNKLEEYEILPDSLEYYELLRSIVLSYLKCRSDCRVRTATVDGEFFDKYLSGHFHYLQFNYFKLNLLNKAAEAASTFRALEPSDTVMANNIKYYRTKLNVSPEHFIPREEIVTLKSFQQSEERLLHFAVTGNPQKRQGERGDSGVLHEEL